MVIYIDVLLFINTIVNYAILATASRLLKRQVRLWRLIMGSFIGALFSLLIFSFEAGFFFLLLLKLSASIITTLVTFGWKRLSEYIKALVGNITVSLLYCGFFILFYQIFKPPNMVIVNDIIYFQVNPLILIMLTALIYLLILAVYKLLSERFKSTVVPLEFVLSGNVYRCIGKIDTACNLKEPFSSAPVIVTDTSLWTIPESLPHRIIPYSAVNSSSFMKAVKADSVTIDHHKIAQIVYIASADLHNPHYQAIINSEILR